MSWGSLLTNYYQVVSVLLFAIGFTALIVDRNLIKKVIGLNIADSGIYLFLASQGYIRGGAIPIISEGINDATVYVNPIPTGLILTGIVISVSVTAFALALIVNLYKRYETLDLDEINRLIYSERI